MNKLINENKQLKYRIIVNGKVINECLTKEIANSTILTLPVELQEHAMIIPVTDEGKQILNESFI